MNSMKYLIRKYQQKDFNDLVEMTQEFQSFLAGADTLGLVITLDNEKAKKYAEVTLKDVETKEGELLVAENENGQLVGFIAGIIDRTPSDFFRLGHKREVQAWIGELFVKERARKTGLGKQLMQEIEIYFKNSGATASWLKVATDNESARAFYCSLGYTEREVELRKPLRKF